MASPESKDDVDMASKHGEVEDELRTSLRNNPYNYQAHIQLLELLRSDLEKLNAARKEFSAVFNLTVGIRSHSLYEIYLEFIKENTKECRAEYLKRLETIHLEIDSTFSNYSSFESNLQDKYDERMKAASITVGKTKKLFKKREEFEIRIKNGGLEDYLLYLDYEKKENDLGRVVRIYERASEIFHGDPYIWNSYINYIINKVKPEIAEKLVYRAISSSLNCMTNCDLWICYLNVVETKKGNIDEIFQRSLYFTSGNFHDLTRILATRLNLAKRQTTPIEELKQLYQQLSEYQISYDPENKDIELQKALAKAYIFNYNEKALGYKIFEQILKVNDRAEIWVEYAETALHIQDREIARDVYRNSVRKYKDNIELLYTAWSKFEETFGSLESIISCREIIFTARETDRRNTKVPEVKLVPNVQEPEQISKKREFDSDDENYQRKKIKKETKVDISQFKTIDSHITDTMIISVFRKYGKIVDFYMSANPENGQLEAFLEYQYPQSVRDVITKGEFDFDGFTLSPQRCRPAEMKWKFRNVEEKDTVYVSNLSSNIDKIILRQHFGYEDAQESCKLNLTEIENDRQVSVAISNPQKKTFHEADERVLYVTNLSKSILEPDLKSLFAPCGSIKDIRIICDGKNNPRGFGYVRFQDVESAKKGLELNNTKVDNRYITVSIADPNKHKKPFNDQAKQTASLVPRVIGRSHQKSVLKKDKPNENKSTDQDLKPKSQDDFRKMLLGKK
ncbi:Splicing factor [Terramyces sp. JEL0728]|nr:Splicing factor [Terramyces sp. JEL0728]